MFQQVLVMTSNSQRCFIPGEQIIKYCSWFLTVDTAWQV